jgi:hypothetical protein
LTSTHNEKNNSDAPRLDADASAVVFAASAKELIGLDLFKSDDDRRRFLRGI